MNNTIILKRGYTRLTESEYKRFSKGDTIWGADREPEELKRWSIENKTEAEKELAKYKSSYIKSGQLWHIEEYTLEYCECDEDGEFIEGSDYDLAEDAYIVGWDLETGEHGIFTHNAQQAVFKTDTEAWNYMDLLERMGHDVSNIEVEKV